MKKKIVVPEGMLKTAIQESRCADVSLMTVGLQSALRWLIENPILVSDEVAMEVWGTVTGKFSGKLIAAMFQNIQRRMFLAPEEDYVDRILKNASPGYTPTHAELDKIWDHIFRAGHGWTPPELRNRGDEFGEKMNDLTVEVNRVGGVVEAAKILRDKDNNPDPIIETLNRRMAEYSDWFHKNLQNLFDKKPFEPRLDWDKPGRKVFTYGDVVKK
jgi:hypothetical protein